MHDRHSHDLDDPPDWGVMRCACGTFKVKLGPLTLDFTPQQFLRLQHLLAAAVAQLHRTPSEEGAPESDSPHKPH